MDAAATTTPGEPTAWHALAVHRGDDAARPPTSNAGLDSAEAASRLGQYGPNRLPRGQEARPTDALPGPVQQHPRLRPARRRLRQADARPVARRVDHPRRRDPQRPARLHPGGRAPRRRSTRSATCSRPRRARVRGGETRMIAGRGAGARRRRAARIRRQGAGRPAPRRGQEPAHRGGGAHRRIGAGRQVDRAGVRQRPPSATARAWPSPAPWWCRAARPASSSPPAATPSSAASTSCSPASARWRRRCCARSRQFGYAITAVIARRQRR